MGLWIARAGLKAALPASWKPCQTFGDEGQLFYFNFETGESVWDHPCDEYHRQLYRKHWSKKYGVPFNEDEPIDPNDPTGANAAAAAAAAAAENSATLDASQLSISSATDDKR